MSRHPELTELVERLREEYPRPALRWGELVERIRLADPARTDPDSRRPGPN